MEYTVFSDESYSTAERYSSIAAVSLPLHHTDDITQDLTAILNTSNVREFKWKKLKTAQYRLCAEKIIDYLFTHIFTKNLRIDVIIWDTQDFRHKIPGRDDTANFERMFFHLMKHLMTRREKDAVWHIYPDERMGIDWQTIQQCLVSVGKWRQYVENALFGDSFSDQFFHIKTFEQINSKQTPCCQIADLFAGMAAFSKSTFATFKQWCDAQNPQLNFLCPAEEVKCTNSQRERFQLIQPFVDQCKNMKLGVSVTTNQCLNTFNPKHPINFWHYEPQHPLDKAPTRKKL